MMRDCMAKYIVYDENLKNDQIIEAKNINEAIKIAKATFGDKVKVQKYKKEDQDLWK